MFRILTWSLTLALAGLWACDDAGTGNSIADCRRAENACAQGYRCTSIGGGHFDCLPGRDAMPMYPDAFIIGDAAGNADMRGLADGVVTRDARSWDMETTTDQGITSSDSSIMTPLDARVTRPDAVMASDAESMAADSTLAPPVDALVPQPFDFAVEMIDAARPPMPIDAAVAMPIDMGGGGFGPGRCNFDAMHPLEARDRGGQDQNGAMQIRQGRYEDMTVGGVDTSDWFRIELCAGGDLSIHVQHLFDGTDLDLDIWHPRQGRLGQSQGQCTGEEGFRWHNDGDIVDIRFNVYPWAPPGHNGNNRYNLEVVIRCN